MLGEGRTIRRSLTAQRRGQTVGPGLGDDVLDRRQYRRILLVEELGADLGVAIDTEQSWVRSFEPIDTPSIPSAA